LLKERVKTFTKDGNSWKRRYSMATQENPRGNRYGTLLKLWVACVSVPLLYPWRDKQCDKREKIQGGSVLGGKSKWNRGLL